LIFPTVEYFLSCISCSVDCRRNRPCCIASGLPFISISNQTAATAVATAIPTPFAPTFVATPPSTHVVRGSLSPQMAIPHYIPPACASWVAQIPALSVQDRPLVPPIFNGINPNYPGERLMHAHPPIFVVEDFLSHAECEFLIEAASASDSFAPAPVVGRGSGGEVSPSQTSSTCYLTFWSIFVKSAY
jgi:hypothetical protein